MSEAEKLSGAWNAMPEIVADALRPLVDYLDATGQELSACTLARIALILLPTHIEDARERLIRSIEQDDHRDTIAALRDELQELQEGACVLVELSR